MKPDLTEEVISVNGFNRVLRQASRNVTEKWRQLTFAGIVRIPFPVTAPRSRETAVEYDYAPDYAQTEAFHQSVRDRIRPGSAPSRL